MTRTDRSHYTLSTGRTFYANNGIVGLAPECTDGFYEGYDGEQSTAGEDWNDPPVPGWTPEERAELADFMMALWIAWKTAGSS